MAWSVLSIHCISWWISLGDCKSNALLEFLSVTFHFFKCQMWGCFYLHLFCGKSGIHRRDSSSAVVAMHFTEKEKKKKSPHRNTHSWTWKGRKTIHQVKLVLKCRSDTIGYACSMEFSSHFLRIITGKERGWVGSHIKRNLSAKGRTTTF